MLLEESDLNNKTPTNVSLIKRIHYNLISKHRQRNERKIVDAHNESNKYYIPINLHKH